MTYILGLFQSLGFLSLEVLLSWNIFFLSLEDEVMMMLPIFFSLEMRLGLFWQWQVGESLEVDWSSLQGSQQSQSARRYMILILAGFINVIDSEQCLLYDQAMLNVLQLEYIYSVYIFYLLMKVQKEKNKNQTQQQRKERKERTKRIRKKVQERKQKLQKRKLQENLSSNKSDKPSHQQNQQKEELQNNGSSENNSSQQKLKVRKVKNRQSALRSRKNKEVQIDQLSDQINTILASACHTCQQHFQTFKNQPMNKPQFRIIKESQFIEREQKLSKAEIQKLKNKQSAQRDRDNKKRMKNALNKQLKKVKLLKAQIQKRKNRQSAQRDTENQNRMKNSLNQQLKKVKLLKAQIQRLKNKQSAQRDRDNKKRMKDALNQQLKKVKEIIKTCPECLTILLDDPMQGNDGAHGSHAVPITQMVQIQSPLNRVREQQDEGPISNLFFLGGFLFIITIAVIGFGGSSPHNDQRLLVQRCPVNDSANKKSLSTSVNQTNSTSLNEPPQTMSCRKTRQQLKQILTNYSKMNQIYDKQKLTYCSVEYNSTQVCALIEYKKIRLTAHGYNLKNYTETLCASNTDEMDLSNEEQLFFHYIGLRINNWLNFHFEQIKKAMPQQVSIIQLGRQDLRTIIVQAQMIKEDLSKQISSQRRDIIQSQSEIGFNQILSTIMGNYVSVKTEQL